MRSVSVALQDPALQLVLLVAAIHLLDAGRLLWADEGLLLHSGFGWRAMTGSDAWRLAGRRLVFPLLLRPAVMVRLTWDLPAVTPGAPMPSVIPRPPAPMRAAVAGLEARVRTLRPLLVWGHGLAILLFGLLPLTWAARFGDGILAATLVAVYAMAFGLAVHLVCRHRALGLPLRRALALGGECLLCPPLAVTLAARLGPGDAVAGDFLAVADGLLPPGRRARLRHRAGGCCGTR